MILPPLPERNRRQSWDEFKAELSRDIRAIERWTGRKPYDPVRDGLAHATLEGHARREAVPLWRWIETRLARDAYAGACAAGESIKDMAIDAGYPRGDEWGPTSN